MKPFRGRREDHRLVSGTGGFTSDFDLDGQLHAWFLRADPAHAHIERIDAAAARAAPGVQLVLTGADFAGKGFRTLPPLAQLPGRGGMALQIPERLPLAYGKVRFSGEPVALVVADSLHAARDASELIDVRYAELTAVVGVEQAIAPGAPLLHEGITGNVGFEFEYGDEQRTKEALARAAHVARVVVESPRVAPTPMEPRSVLASFEAESGRYIFRCPHQGAQLMCGQLATMLGVDAERMRLEFVDVGGAFGARCAPYYEYVALLHAAKLLGAPVKWVSTRSDDFLNDGHGRGVRLAGEIGLDASGRILGLRTEWLADTGAYQSSSGSLTNSLNGKTIGAGAYVVGAMYGRHRQVFTNAAPTEAYRGAGRPEAVLAVERLLDAAAVEMRIDPIELRRRNAIPREAMPYTTLTGTVFDSADFRGMLDAVEKASGWQAFPERRAQAQRKARLRGIGCGLFIEPSGGAAVPKDQVAVKFASSGEVQLFIAAGASGQGHETIFPEMVAEWLGLEASSLVLRAGDPDGPKLIGGAAIGSRTAFSQGSAFKIASDEIVRKGRDLAAEALEAATADIDFRAGVFHVKGTDRAISIQAIIERYRTDPHPLDTIGESVPSRAFPSGAHVCEVEIDPETGAAEIIAYTAVDDIGHPVNPVLAEGQILGGVVQSIGHVFGESVAYDSQSGQLLCGTFMDYTMPRADGLPMFSLLGHNLPSPNNPLGVKGVGEAGTTAALSTCLNAVLDALRSAGVEQFSMPASPYRVWRALQSRQP